MQAHAEHQEDDAQLGQLRPQLEIGDKARRIGTNEHAGKQIPHQRRHPEPVGDHAEDIGQHQTRDDRCDQGGVMVHQRLRRSWLCRLKQWGIFPRQRKP